MRPVQFSLKKPYQNVVITLAPDQIALFVTTLEYTKQRYEVYFEGSCFNGRGLRALDGGEIIRETRLR